MASLNLTENMSLALDYRMSSLSYPEIAKQLSRAVSTVYEYFEKMRARYSAITDKISISYFIKGSCSIRSGCLFSCSSKHSFSKNLANEAKNLPH